MIKSNSNYLLGSILTLITGKKPFPLFRTSHLLIHHPPKILGSMSDTGNTPLLLELGFSFGEDPDYYWQKLLQVMLTPSFYWTTFVNRVSALAKAPLFYKVAVVAFFASGLILLNLTHTLGISLFWWFSTQVASYPAALMQQLIEHDWAYLPLPKENAKSLVVNKSLVIYLGSHPPESSNICSWLGWFAKMGLNILIRITFLPVSLPAHGLHHALPNNKNWANQVFALRAFQSGQERGWQAYRFKEVWGFRNALRLVFQGFSDRSLN